MLKTFNDIRLYMDILSENSINNIDLPFKTFKFTVFGGEQYSIVGWDRRAFIVIDINGVAMPFYLSSGLGGKANVPSGKWYPFFGVGADGWLNKGSQDIIAEYYASNILKEICKSLDNVIGDIRSTINTLPRVDFEIIMQTVNRDVHPSSFGNPIPAWNNINQTLVKIGASPILRPSVELQINLFFKGHITEKQFKRNIELIIKKYPEKRNDILTFLKDKVSVVFNNDLENILLGNPVF